MAQHSTEREESYQGTRKYSPYSGGEHPKQSKEIVSGLPWWLSGKESIYQSRRHGFDPWSRRTPHAVEQLSPCATALEPGIRNYWTWVATTDEQVPWSLCSVPGEACTATREPPPLASGEKAPAVTKTQHSQQEINKKQYRKEEETVLVSEGARFSRRRLQSRY